MLSPQFLFYFVLIGKRSGARVVYGRRDWAITVESLITDTPNKGHCIKYLSTMDTTKSPNFNPPINIMQLEYLKRGQSLYSGQIT